MDNLRQVLLAKKSYMLEFVSGVVPQAEEVFTFSVPPEAEEFDFTQRVVETKTFGGSVFDSYGNDTIHITLSGSTINNESKFIYRGLTKLPEYLTGEEEIYRLQELLYKWQDLYSDSMAVEDKHKKIYLYDLSKMTLADMALGKPTRNWYRVVVKSLKIKRDKSKPLTYNYTLDMLGVIDKDAKPKGLLTGKVAEAVSKVQTAVKAIQKGVKLTQEVVAAADAVVEAANKAYIHYKRVGASLKANYDAIGEALQGEDTPAKAVGVIGASAYGINSTIAQEVEGHTRLFSSDTNRAFYNSSLDVLHMASIVQYNLREKWLGKAWYGFGQEGDSGISKEEVHKLLLPYIQKPSRYIDKARYRVVFCDAGELPSIWVNYGESMGERLPTPTRQGYTFRGWYTSRLWGEGAYYDKDTLVAPKLEGDIVLYARWV